MDLMMVYRWKLLRILHTIRFRY